MSKTTPLDDLIKALTPAERNALAEHDLGSGLGRLVRAVQAAEKVRVTYWKMRRSPSFLNTVQLHQAQQAGRVTLAVENGQCDLGVPEILALCRQLIIAAGEVGGVRHLNEGETYITDAGKKYHLFAALRDINTLIAQGEDSDEC